MSDPPRREREVLAELARRFGGAPRGQLWAGDDAAVIAPLERPIVTTDLVVEGVHVDRRWSSPEDIGFKAVSANVSDLAAMGGAPRALVVGIAGATAGEIARIMDGAAAAADRYGCDIVGGDLADGGTLVVAITAIGECEHEPVTRSGAAIGDGVFVTAPLGSSAAGLRVLRRDPADAGALAASHRRPVARVREGRLLGALGAHAMVDCSDGLADAATVVARASGCRIFLDEVPVAPGATEEDALYGGEDYELLFCASAAETVRAAFAEAGYAAPIWIGTVAAHQLGAPGVTLRGVEVVDRGYEHALGTGSIQ